MANPKITIAFDDMELQEIEQGRHFKWTFVADDGQEIDVLVHKEVDEVCYCDDVGLSAPHMTSDH